MMVKFFQSIFGRPHISRRVPLTPDLSKIPCEVRNAMSLYDPWIVGGGARYVVGLSDNTPKDYDFVIPKGEDEARFERDLRNKKFAEWEDAIDSDTGYRFEPWATSTSMGGHRLVISKELTLDVWFDDVATYLAEVPTVWDGLAIRLSSGAMVVSSELAQEMRNRLIEDRDTRRHQDIERFREHLAHQGLAKAYLRSRSQKAQAIVISDV